jgi:hypothetical protein
MYPFSFISFIWYLCPKIKFVFNSFDTFHKTSASILSHIYLPKHLTISFKHKTCKFVLIVVKSNKSKF